MNGPAACPEGSMIGPPTCFPTPPTGQCVTDHVLQLGSSSFIPRYTRQFRSYATTPAECPARGYWKSAVHFWWADGSEDHVVVRQPCRRSPRTT